MIISYKYKLKPNKTQSSMMEDWLNVCRLVYNLTLEQKDYAYKTHQRNVSKYESYNQLPELKSEFTFIKSVHSDTLQEVVDRVHKAYDKFFKGGGFPKFKKKGLYNSFTFKRSFSIQDNHIKLPKIGKVKFYNSRPINGTMKTATITKELDGWYISITVDVETTYEYCDNQAVGVDVGVVNFLTLSDGTVIKSLQFLEPKLKELRKLQRKFARQIKGSNSREKTKRKIAKLYQKISRCRQDFLHKQSTIIANKYSEVYIEDLKVQQMLKTNSTLSRKMLDNGFYSFRLMLDYKLKLRSKIFKVVPAYYTSQTCSNCGHTHEDNRKTQSQFTCVSCGHSENADLNASKNILALGKSYSTKAKPLG